MTRESVLEGGSKGDIGLPYSGSCDARKNPVIQRCNRPCRAMAVCTNAAANCIAENRPSGCIVKFIC